MIELINPILRGWVNYFAVGHSGRCFSFIKDWVEKKIRRQRFPKEPKNLVNCFNGLHWPDFGFLSRSKAARGPTGFLGGRHDRYGYSQTPGIVSLSEVPPNTIMPQIASSKN